MEFRNLMTKQIRTENIIKILILLIQHLINSLLIMELLLIILFVKA